MGGRDETTKPRDEGIAQGGQQHGQEGNEKERERELSEYPEGFIHSGGAIGPNRLAVSLAALEVPAEYRWPGAALCRGEVLCRYSQGGGGGGFLPGFYRTVTRYQRCLEYTIPGQV